ncbi:FliI/YscN family ATPase [Methylocystis sp. Sn-Cys]|uniref:FliI/YscN family ATPase n=1 Tax=Methylocystis sp. Sn-Cys TaxID=1701263 RepID=UPI00192292E2|nr:FliI/YscN family ATPase [Methylocystis sp. Sn-Cys]MBL1258676.1 flagellar protein export ATPase FliI [Methylocystis sp. Sn-Cys]
MSKLAQLQRSAELFARTERQIAISGAVVEVTPTYFRTAGLSKFVKLGDCVGVETARGETLAQVVRIDQNGVIVKAFENNSPVGLGSKVRFVGPIELLPHESWRGRVLDAFGRPVDGQGPVSAGLKPYYLDAPPPAAMRRTPITKPLRTGVRAIDAFTPICEGQRIGIFAGSGVGKSTLLEMLSRAGGFSVAVICLVGERGREVRDFVDTVISANPGGVVTIVATADESPMMRRMAPLTATTIAEFFRDAGASVVLIVDSVTRYAHAAREVALASGEPPVANGYTPSVFADLPRLLERAGPGEDGVGAVTGIYSVLVDGDNHNDPIADCIRGTLDGHIVLDREIAEQGRYPAINLLKSISRLADRVWTPDEREMVMRLKSMLAKFEETRDLRMLGGYHAGVDAELDRAVVLSPVVYDALRQAPKDPPAVVALEELAERINRGGG